MLNIQNLSVRYNKINAVNAVNLEVFEGEIVALLGKNGSGKSSILNAICGIVPHQGTVHFNGKLISGLPPHQILNRKISIVPEGRMLFSNMTIKENLLIGGNGLSTSELQNKLEQVLELFPQLRKRLPDQSSALSGGEAQTLAIARGLIANPDLLLLDEPTLGLSPIAKKQFFTLIKQLNKQGLSILIVEQNVRQVLTIADRGYILEGGSIALKDTAQGLIDNKDLNNVYLGLQTLRS